MQRQVSRVILAFAMGLFALGIQSAEAEEPSDTVVNYTEALRAGDTAGVKSYIGGRLYEKREVLLDQNEEYPDFLRKRYDGAVFQISDELIDLGAQGQGIAIEVSFPTGHISKSIVIVEQAQDGSWEIVDEVEASP
jgi:hypothetical protein